MAKSKHQPTSSGIRSVARKCWYFYRNAPTRIAAIMALLVVTGLLENIGILTMLPALQIAMQGEFSDSRISAMVVEAMAMIGLEPTLVTALALAAALVTVKVALTMAVGFYSSITMLDMIREMRERIATHLLRARWTHFADARTGRYVNLLGSEADRATPALNNGVFLVTGFVHALLYIGSALLVSAPISLMVIGLGALKLFVSRPIISMGRHAGSRQSGSAASLGTHLVEILHMAKPIKAMAREKDAERILLEDIGNHRMAQRGGYLSSHALLNLDEFLITMILLACFYVTVNVLNIGVAELAVVGVLMSRTLNKIAQVQKRYLAIVTGEAALGGLVATMGELQAQQESSHGGLLPTLDSRIEFRGVHVSHPGHPVLDNVTIDIPARSLTVILGPSGSGKTTLVDALLGLTAPDRGDILLDGHSLYDVDLAAWRGMTGYVPQETTLLHGSIRDNITLRSQGIPDSAVIDALTAAEALDFVMALRHGLDAHVGERGLKLSGGQRQRLAIARALVHQPKLLILDEATSALDENTELELCRTFRRLAEEVTVIAVSHQPAICQMADRIYRIDGRTLKADPMRQCAAPLI
jgi:ATP-binding cassette subfamily C protein